MFVRVQKVGISSIQVMGVLTPILTNPTDFIRVRTRLFGLERVFYKEFEKLKSRLI